MAYVKESDYTLRISIDHLTEILTQAAATSGLTTTQIRQRAEAVAEAEIRSYLISKYKIAQEFALDATTNDTSRNHLILQWYLDISLFNIHFTVNPRDIPETREKQYKMAMQGLAAARDANIVLEIDQVEPFYTRHKIGSNCKFISHEFTDPSLYE